LTLEGRGDSEPRAASKTGPLGMEAAAMGSERTMTDYQFRSIIRMILSIAESKRDLTEVIEELRKLLDENEKNPGEEKTR
jgi:hypothetical protein